MHNLGIDPIQTEIITQVSTDCLKVKIEHWQNLDITI